MLEAHALTGGFEGNKGIDPLKEVPQNHKSTSSSHAKATSYPKNI